ncbi:hypothetical protein EDC01DRAFT_631586 [Geopyxis carbonaria]|nr:hypothetical protein EDC01DRAFT_631586 [Geopyxis carbonaria]
MIMEFWLPLAGNAAAAQAREPLCLALEPQYLFNHLCSQVSPTTSATTLTKMDPQTPVKSCATKMVNTHITIAVPETPGPQTPVKSCATKMATTHITMPVPETPGPETPVKSCATKMATTHITIAVPETPGLQLPPRTSGLPTPPRSPVPQTPPRKPRRTTSFSPPSPEPTLYEVLDEYNYFVNTTILSSLQSVINLYVRHFGEPDDFPHGLAVAGWSLAKLEMMLARFSEACYWYGHTGGTQVPLVLDEILFNADHLVQVLKSTPGDRGLLEMVHERVRRDLTGERVMMLERERVMVRRSPGRSPESDAGKRREEVEEVEEVEGDGMEVEVEVEEDKMEVD